MKAGSTCGNWSRFLSISHNKCNIVSLSPSDRWPHNQEGIVDLTFNDLSAICYFCLVLLACSLSVLPEMLPLKPLTACEVFNFFCFSLLQNPTQCVRPASMCVTSETCWKVWTHQMPTTEWTATPSPSSASSLTETSEVRCCFKDVMCSRAPPSGAWILVWSVLYVNVATCRWATDCWPCLFLCDCR